MNRKPTADLKSLEDATTTMGDAVGRGATKEVRDLQSTWLAFGMLVRNGATPGDQEEFVQAVRARLLRAKRRRETVLWSVGSALAAALTLVAWLGFSGRGVPVEPAVKPGLELATKSAVSPAPTLDPNPVPSTVVSPRRPIVRNVPPFEPWADDLDEQFESIHDGFVDVDASGFLGDPALAAVDQEIQQVAEELDLSTW